MTPFWRYLVLRADAWLTCYIRRAVPAAHHIGQVEEFCETPEGLQVRARPS